jgi:hypothetical protein
MALADELEQIADEAARARERLEELARACAELRAQLQGTEPSAHDDAPRKLQSVS